MAGNFEVEFNDYGLVAKIKGRADRLVEHSQRLAERGAEAAAQTMRMLAPRGERSNKDSSAGKLRNRISWSRARWHPGGAGGGGFWEAIAGVRKSPLHPVEKDPVTFVTQGTGIFGPSGHVITPRVGNLLVFESGGRTFFTKFVKGQKPQRGWIESAQKRAEAVVAEGLAFIDAVN